jgi:exodeoxyribonuclease-3
MSGSSFSVATWNVNSLKVRLPHLGQWLQSSHVDVVALQETKVTDADFPFDEIRDLGYRVVAHGQRTYNGVALLARSEISDVLCGIPDFSDEQARVLAATVEGVRIIDVYVPNGQSVGSDKYLYKLRWLDALRTYLTAALQEYSKVIVLGDFNIAPEDRDVHDVKAWEGQVLVSEPERAALAGIRDLGFIDTFRQSSQAAGAYSWWDYRQGAFRRNAGLRIDLVLASERLSKDLDGCLIEREPRGWERPSDHTPVVASFNLK